METSGGDELLENLLEFSVGLVSELLLDLDVFDDV
jgi:hypothetical protein